jgi:hypothetical protein
MHPASTVDAALELSQSGENASDIARRLEIPRSTVRDWLAGSTPRRDSCHGCPSCGADHRFAELTESYVYLLGMYLGDGYIAAHHRGVYGLRISLDVRYPQIIESCETAIREVAPANRVGRVNYDTWIELCCWSKMWPCLFPQHGPGKKHQRSIRLTDWQQKLVDRWPHRLIRGLIQSDGCRFQDTGRGGWSCARYAFVNRSDDIRTIFCRTCDQMGVRWTASGASRIYVSRKADVAFLDRFIGPKR